MSINYYYNWLWVDTLPIKIEIKGLANKTNCKLISFSNGTAKRNLPRAKTKEKIKNQSQIMQIH